MKAFDPETSETYMFIGCEQEKKIDKEKVLERVSLEEWRCRKEWKV